MSNLFRKKSVEHISSPEQLNSYIRVSTPSVWLLLTAIAVSLAGVCVWGIFGHMDTVLPVLAVSENNMLTAYVTETDVQKIPLGAPVSVSTAEGSVISVRGEPVCVDDSFTEYMRHVGGLREGQWVYALTLDLDCPEGVHTAQIVIDSVRPMFFVLN